MKMTPTNQPSNPQSQELLPCPFCGGKAKMRQPHIGTFVVECGNCGLKGSPWSFESTSANWWNTRHTPTPPLPDDLAKAIEPLLLKNGLWHSPFEQGFNEALSERCSKNANRWAKYENPIGSMNVNHDYWNLGFEMAMRLKAAAKHSQELRDSINNTEAATGMCGIYTQLEHQLRAKDELIEKLEKDKQLIDWIDSIIRPGGDDYCEIYISGLRWCVRPNMKPNEQFTMSEAQGFQVESNPEKFKTVMAISLREALSLAREQGFGKDK